MRAYLKGKLRVELRDIRNAGTDDAHVMLAPVLLDDDGAVLCELEVAIVRPTQGLVIPDSVTLIPLEGHLSPAQSVKDQEKQS